MQQHTLAVFKPDCLERRLVGKVMERIYDDGFQIVAMKMIKLSTERAEQFYREHQAKDFFPFLVKFITEGPIIVAVLEKENAIEEWRELMGKTDPDKAQEETIRHDFAENMRRNIVHGSDSLESAQREISFFFDPSEIYEIIIDR